jgi:leader peptidase (prepilin peptidase)/N-methyltransferase
MVKATLDPQNWAAVPFHFWTVVMFVFGSMVGSFLNVCIYRMPLGLSVVSPPSHCPKCKYSIPAYLNIPLFTWMILRGRCRNCRDVISPRYFLVELLTALLFAFSWLGFGGQSVGTALVYCLVLAGLVAATFIDFEHFIIPDEITVGGMIVGFFCSFFVPGLHGQVSSSGAMRQSLLGAALGGGVIYGILRLGKLLFGRQRLTLPAETRVLFTETALRLPDKDVPYEDLFYRPSDVVCLQAKTVELVDRCYKDVHVRLSPDLLQIGDEKLNPAEVPYMEAVSAEIVLPREAMGFGDVKFMAGIGAFLGWKAVLFSLMASSLIGSMVGVFLILIKRQVWSSRLPYGPYIAIGAVIWMFGGRELLDWWMVGR